MSLNTDLEKALAELAYAIAYADGILEDVELEAFESIILEEMLEDAEGIRNQFLILGERDSPNIEQSYRQAMFAIKQNKEHFTEENKDQCIKVITRIANSVQGLREEERKLIERFKKDVNLI